MRHVSVRSWGVAVALSLVLVGGVTSASVADDSSSGDPAAGSVPTEQDIADAQAAAGDKARDVSSVRSDLVLANQRLDDSAVEAAMVAESYNGTLWRLDQARQAARAADRRADAASADVRRQREVYGAALVRTYELAPGVTGLSAMVGADGIQGVVERGATMANAEDALDGRYDQFRATATLADVASDQATEARAEAAELEREARTARDAAQAAANAALAQAESIAAEKTRLISELAELQGISVALAQKRQTALEQAAAEAAAEAAAKAAEEAAAKAAAEAAAAKAAADAAKKAADKKAADDAKKAADDAAKAAADDAAKAAADAAEKAAADPAKKDTKPAPNPSPPPAPAPAPAPNPPPAPPAPPAPPPAPPSTGSASAAIAFARAQIGDPYQWGGAGPNSWDCSGLTMGAWAAGGISLPHYSVAQYSVSTKIAATALQPGDLVFWGSSSNPSSIYHMGLYVGGGQMIHAPRTGRPVVQESMYSWRAPNFFARP